MKSKKHTVKSVKRSRAAKMAAGKEAFPVRVLVREPGSMRARVMEPLDGPLLRIGSEAPPLVHELASSPVKGARLLGALLGAVMGDVRDGRALSGEGLQEEGWPQEGPDPSRAPQKGPAPSHPPQDGAVKITLREDGMAEWTTPTGQVVVAPYTRPGEDWRKGITKAPPGIWDTPEAKAYLETLQSEDE